MTRSDQQLISEAYSAVSFKQTLPNMSLGLLRENVYNLNSTQLSETTEVLHELFGGLKNVFGGLKNTASAAGQAIKSGAQQVGQAVKGAGRAVAAGAQQVGSNVASMYKTGQQQAAVTSQQKQAKDLVDKLVGTVEKLKSDPTFQQLVKYTRGGQVKNVESLTLKEIQTILANVVGQATQSAQTAAQQGIFGGAGQAAGNAYNQPTP